MYTYIYGGVKTIYNQPNKEKEKKMNDKEQIENVIQLYVDSMDESLSLIHI